MKDELNDRLDAALQAKWVSRQMLLRKLLREASPVETGHRGTSPRKMRGVTPEQYVIINILHSYGHGVSVKEITGAIDIPHANVTRTLDRLEKKGLIHRTRGSDDRRQMIVRLTLEGTKAARSLSGVEERLYTAFWGKYSVEEKALMVELISR